MVWHDCLVRPDYVAWHDELGMAWHDCWHGSRRRCCAEVVRSKGEVLPSSRAGPARFLGSYAEWLNGWAAERLSG